MNTHGTPDPHVDLGPLAGLLGTWAGSGHGDYPTISPFDYLEEVTFGHVGKPFLAYTQRTRHADTGAPLHAEAGYLRPGTNGVVELVIAQPTGLVEVLTGRLERPAGAEDDADPGADGCRLDLRSATVAGTPSSLPVHATRRLLSWDASTLRYDLWMAHGDTPETHHLHAELQRQGPR